VDDIIVSAASKEEHHATLELVMKRLGDAGLKLKRSKCRIGVPEVQYLGHRLTAEGITPLPEKVEAIKSFEAPSCKQELSTFCGMLKYYHRFIPNISDVMAPLYKLEKKETKWKWEEEEEKAFREAKSMLSQKSLLVYYNPDERLVMTCDASAYGIGAVIEQERNGIMQPVSFASRTLTGSEKNYSQTEKEGLALVWGVSKFQKYLQGREFEVWTDHKPLLGLLASTKGIPTMASGRIIRWSILLSSYNYTLKYVPGAKIPNADCLSRFPMKTMEQNVPAVGEEVLLLDHMDYTVMTSDDIRRWTDRDPTLSGVRQAVLSGWSDEVDPEMQPYYLRKDELAVLQGCVLWGSRVIIPPQGRDGVTEELHATHPGIVKMKNLARAYLWWPNMEKDLERRVNTCKECQSTRVMRNTRQPLHPWEYPDRAWSRLHIDYAGPMEGRMFLVIVDAYSKWVEVIQTSGCTSRVTVRKLVDLFTTHGLPDTIVSDNGTAFTSEEFQEFLRHNGIRHVKSAPFHPSTNGLAENAVNSFKRAVKKETGETLETKLQRYLFMQRITPHCTTGVPPCELLMKRRLKSKFDLLRPSVEDHVRNKQEKQARQHGGKEANIGIGDHVYLKNYSTRGPAMYQE
jgi:transposase InsO family protein